MNVSDFTYLLKDPKEVKTSDQTQQIEELIEAYPWFQAARAIHLYGLKHLNSYKYNQALKHTAACTSDREVLFDLITSEEFIQNRIADAISGKHALEDQEIISEEVVPNLGRDTDMIEKEEDSPLPRNTQEADKILDPKLFRSKDPEMDKTLEAAKEDAKKTLQIGTPLEFTKNERHSFSQWLQLTHMTRSPQEQEPQNTGEDENQNPIRPSDGKRKKKFELIDRFIADNPKMKPGATDVPEVDIEESLKLDKKQLMTQTLARVYLEQGKYKKAIQAYRILILKYPEKSSFFADQIQAVEKLRAKKSQ
ncbi:tetratricopeptide repeat protein [Robiginitalea aurantiaca]|uniref:Tetratricopeptide repeat protein n=1 Tax=Robiginitalea aurantiaca TaxID=3056915 RepID=A0ABT7WF41_9FLAO|nr:tetratricopeptide repeat protein [Robiginitalea aurantiaca]MDM9631535.1 tetratricopeptide repeat protein [Robiginitalea aurantiaca]